MNPYNFPKSKLKKNITYLICPDPDCNLYVPDSPLIQTCDISCPREEDLVKIVLCDFCSEIIELDGF